MIDVQESQGEAQGGFKEQRHCIDAVFENLCPELRKPAICRRLHIERRRVDRGVARFLPRAVHIEDVIDALGGLNPAISQQIFARLPAGANQDAAPSQRAVSHLLHRTVPAIESAQPFFYSRDFLVVETEGGHEAVGLSVTFLFDRPHQSRAIDRNGSLNRFPHFRRALNQREQVKVFILHRRFQVKRLMQLGTGRGRKKEENDSAHRLSLARIGKLAVQ
ncbi:MAG TPA: hypothetical protein VEF06_05610 [Bryobacteraceae bacterium]|nr:hypothetical protein [Bryobacteraceae bacterium]